MEEHAVHGSLVAVGTWAVDSYMEWSGRPVATGLMAGIAAYYYMKTFGHKLPGADCDCHSVKTPAEHTQDIKDANDTENPPNLGWVTPMLKN